MKLYTVSLRARAKSYKIAGFGAIHTRKDFRHRGFASSLIDEALQLARDNGYSGAILFSDIDPQFYIELGFIQFGCADFSVDLLLASRDRARPAVEPPYPLPVYLERSHVPCMARLYKRWQKSQPFLSIAAISISITNCAGKAT